MLKVICLRKSVLDHWRIKKDCLGYSWLIDSKFSDVICTIGSANDLIGSGQPRARNGDLASLYVHCLVLGWPPSIKSLVNPRVHVRQNKLHLKTQPLIFGTVLLFSYRHISPLGSSRYPLLRSCYKVCLRTVAWGCHTCVPVSFCQYHMSYCNSTTGPIPPSLRRLKRRERRISSENQPSNMLRLILGTRKVTFI